MHPNKSQPAAPILLPDGYAVNPSILQGVPSLLHYPLRVRRFASGDRITQFQEPLEELQFMVEGRAKVFSVMENGRAVLHTMIQALSVIGDLEFLRGYPAATTNIQAVTDGVLLTISLAPCSGQLQQDAALLRFLGGELAGKLERSSRQSAQNLLYPLSARLAAYVLFSAQNGLFAENLQHVSELMATSYRHLLRTLRSFCDAAILHNEKDGYRILDAKKLAQEGGSLLWER